MKAVGLYRHEGCCGRPDAEADGGADGGDSAVSVYGSGRAEPGGDAAIPGGGESVTFFEFFAPTLVGWVLVLALFVGIDRFIPAHGSEGLLDDGAEK